MPTLTCMFQQIKTDTGIVCFEFEITQRIETTGIQAVSFSQRNHESPLKQFQKITEKNPSLAHYFNTIARKLWDTHLQSLYRKQLGGFEHLNQEANASLFEGSSQFEKVPFHIKGKEDRVSD